jgi:hypothetical protein
MRETPRRPPDGEWEGTSLGEGVGMDHGKGAGTTEPASRAVGPAGDAGPRAIKPARGGTKTPLRPYHDVTRPKSEAMRVTRLPPRYRRA